MKERPSTTKRFINMGVVLLLLVLLPLGSWYFLQKGYNFTVDKLQQLDSLGKFKVDSFNQWIQFEKEETFYKDKMYLVGQVSSDPSVVKAQRRLHRKFDDREDLDFILFEEGNNQADTFSFLKDTTQVHLISKQVSRKKRYLLGDENALDHNEMYLVDIRQTIRKKYDISKADTVNQLFTHTVLILPKE